MGVFGWTIGIIVLVAAGTVGFGGLAAVTAGNATLFCAAFVVLFIAALLAFASRGSSQS